MVTVTAAVAVPPRQVPSWDFPSVPCLPCQPLPSPFLQLVPSPPVPSAARGGGGPVAESVSEAGWCLGCSGSSVPSLPWAPHQVRAPRR